MGRFSALVILIMCLCCCSSRNGALDGETVEARYASTDNSVLIARFDLERALVRIELPDKRSLTLPLAVSASGARYSNGTETFWEHHSVGRFLVGDDVVFEGTLLPAPPP